MGQAVQQIDTANVMAAEEARQRTDHVKMLITEGLRLYEQLAEELDRVWAGQAWHALGYTSWQQYCASEFAQVHTVKLDAKQRRRLVSRLTARSGMSSRAIASGLGVNQRTVIRDRQATTSEAESAEAHASLPRQNVRGIDGKSHPVNRSPVTRRTIHDEVRGHVNDLETAIGGLEQARASGPWRTYSRELGAVYASHLVTLAERAAVLADEFLIAKTIDRVAS